CRAIVLSGFLEHNQISNSRFLFPNNKQRATNNHQPSANPAITAKLSGNGSFVLTIAAETSFCPYPILCNTEIVYLCSLFKGYFF
ncbi:MAG: hypothetical protein AB7S54_11965, partial [Bacteroidales bacterium]